MPELAEVEFFRKRWDLGKGGRVVEVLLHPHARPLRGLSARDLMKGLSGARLVDSAAHGKQLFFHFHPPATLGIHLGMTGRLRVEEAGYAPGRHDHLVLRQARRSLVFADARMFGRVRFAPGKAKPAWESALPPQVLSPQFTLARCREGITRRRRSPIKAILLDQRLFPGIGNWMADEILWQAGLAPQRLGGSLSAAEIQLLYRKVRAVSRKAVQTISRSGGDHFGRPPREWLFSSRWRAGGKCPRCGAALRRGAVGGRTTCWCAACQPVPRPRRAASARSR